MTDKPFKFSIEPCRSGFRVIREGKDDVGLTIFQTRTREKAAAFLQVYLTLSIEDRRKLRDACAA